MREAFELMCLIVIVAALGATGTVTCQTIKNKIKSLLTKKENHDND